MQKQQKPNYQRKTNKPNPQQVWQPGIPMYWVRTQRMMFEYHQNKQKKIRLAPAIEGRMLKGSKYKTYYEHDMEVKARLVKDNAMDVVVNIMTNLGIEEAKNEPVL